MEYRRTGGDTRRLDWTQCAEMSSHHANCAAYPVHVIIYAFGWGKDEV
jgi:hypothetical protein